MRTKKRTLLQINTVLTTNATGQIAENIGINVMQAEWRSIIVYGRYPRESQSELLRIGSELGIKVHGLFTRLLGRHGLASKGATQKLISEIESIKPDIIHLHNIHGYYLNYPLLFRFLASSNIPVVWTLHDCWSMTGHCIHFISHKCDKWRVGCGGCPSRNSYPQSLIFDNSETHYRLKKKLFCSVKNLTVVAVSDWLASIAKESFLNCHNIVRIHNGIDLQTFYPDTDITLPPYMCGVGSYILGVANPWSQKKGLNDFYELRKLIPDKITIVLVGLNDSQLSNLPQGFVGIKRTEDIAQLRVLYSSALALVNPTWEDSFPTINLEALACGTPVITYETGGSPEAISAQTGRVVRQGDIEGLKSSLEELMSSDRSLLRKHCRERAEKLYDKTERFEQYMELYESLLKNQ